MDKGATATIVERGIIAGGLNMALASFHAAAHGFQFFILPMWLLPRSPSWGWIVLPLALLNNPYWSLLHEAIHDLFHPARSINALFGRALSILFGAPFRVLRLSHLLHHKLNRTPMEATEPYEPGKASWARAAWGYYFQIFGGLYLGELMSSFLFFLPKAMLRRIQERFIKPHSISGILMQNWTGDQALREIRADGALILAGFALALYCYGERWPLLLAILGARGFLISFLDNVYHYRTPINDIFFARNLWLPQWASKCLLNFNLHGIHHQNPALPWVSLPVVFRQGEQPFHGNYLIAAADQFAGPIAIDELPRRVK